MKRRLKVLIGLSMFSLFLFGAAANAAVDFSQMGYPNVAAEKHIKTGEAAKISHSGIKIYIPEGTFDHEVIFQVIEGENEQFQAHAPVNETVIVNFAFRVMDLETNQLIDKFNKPITFSFKDKNINQSSIYYNVKTDGTFVNNNAASVIEKRTLTHPIGGAPVGWVITTPSKGIHK